MFSGNTCMREEEPVAMIQKIGFDNGLFAYLTFVAGMTAIIAWVFSSRCTIQVCAVKTNDESPRGDESNVYQSLDAHESNSSCYSSDADEYCSWHTIVSIPSKIHPTSGRHEMVLRGQLLLQKRNASHQYRLLMPKRSCCDVLDVLKARQPQLLSEERCCTVCLESMRTLYQTTLCLCCGVSLHTFCWWDWELQQRLQQHQGIRADSPRCPNCNAKSNFCDNWIRFCVDLDAFLMLQHHNLEILASGNVQTKELSTFSFYAINEISAWSREYELFRIVAERQHAERLFTELSVAMRQRSLSAVAGKCRTVALHTSLGSLADCPA